MALLLSHSHYGVTARTLVTLPGPSSVLWLNMQRPQNQTNSLICVCPGVGVGVGVGAGVGGKVLDKALVVNSTGDRPVTTPVACSLRPCLRLRPSCSLFRARTRAFSRPFFLCLSHLS